MPDDADNSGEDDMTFFCIRRLCSRRGVSAWLISERRVSTLLDAGDDGVGGGGGGGSGDPGGGERGGERGGE